MNEMDRVTHLRFEAIQQELNRLRTDYRYLRGLQENASDATSHVQSQLYHLQALLESLQRTQTADATDCTAHLPLIGGPRLLEPL
jgi:hypothetical protein